MNYTDRVEGFQIRDVTYIGFNPGRPCEFDVVKWYKHDPPMKNVTIFREGRIYENQTVYESCYSVGSLIWDRKECSFHFESVGMRLFEEKPSDAVMQMILDFAEKKGEELAGKDELR